MMEPGYYWVLVSRGNTEPELAEFCGPDSWNIRGSWYTMGREILGAPFAILTKVFVAPYSAPLEYHPATPPPGFG